MNEIDFDELEYDGDILVFEGVPFTGRAYELLSNGQKGYLSEYKDGLKHGITTYFYPSGKKMEEGHFIKGLKDGPELQWDRDGNLVMRCVYNQDKLTRQEIYNKKQKS